MNPVVGHGVFATRRIPRGTLTWTRCALDRVFTPEERVKLPPEYAPHVYKYGYFDRRGDLVLCWDLGRFMNHSCRPTCVSPGFDLDLAARDIEAGEELTCDYGMLNLMEPFDCSCGLADCRKTILPEDWDTLGSHWDGQVRGAIPEVLRVDQPLREFARDWTALKAAAAGHQPVPSCQGHRLVHAGATLDSFAIARPAARSDRTDRPRPEARDSL